MGTNLCPEEVSKVLLKVLLKYVLQKRKISLTYPD